VSCRLRALLDFLYFYFFSIFFPLWFIWSVQQRWDGFAGRISPVSTGSWKQVSSLTFVACQNRIQSLVLLYQIHLIREPSNQSDTCVHHKLTILFISSCSLFVFMLL
jgi:hypothetical protein